MTEFERLDGLASRLKPSPLKENRPDCFPVLVNSLAVDLSKRKFLVHPDVSILRLLDVVEACNGLVKQSTYFVNCSTQDASESPLSLDLCMKDFSRNAKGFVYLSIRFVHD